MLLTILVVVLILSLIGTGPWYGYSAGWGYGPSGLIGAILIILLIILLIVWLVRGHGLF